MKKSTLNNLADKYKSDKGPGRHSYTQVYEAYFSGIKSEAKKICEIGIWQGASLKMFKDYFKNAVIYGIDIHNAPGINVNRIKTFIADQADRKQLKKFIDKFGADFDIIIDDGGHLSNQQQISLGYLFKYLRPGGYYIIEDIQNPLIYNKRNFSEDKEDMTFFMVIDNIKKGVFNSRFLTKKENKYLSDNIEFCNLIKINDGESIACVYKKK